MRSRIAPSAVATRTARGRVEAVGEVGSVTGADATAPTFTAPFPLSPPVPTVGTRAPRLHVRGLRSPWHLAVPRLPGRAATGAGPAAAVRGRRLLGAARLRGRRP